jgi:hypothetical protein
VRKRPCWKLLARAQAVGALLDTSLLQNVAK